MTKFHFMTHDDEGLSCLTQQKKHGLYFIVWTNRSSNDVAMILLEFFFGNIINV